MRKIIILGLAFCLASCGIRQQREREKFVQDSIAHEVHVKDSLWQIQIDSLKQVKMDSLSMIAWGQLKFGMTPNEVMKFEPWKKANKSQLKKDGKIYVFPSDKYREAIGLKPFSSCLLTAYFTENGLYKVELELWENPKYDDNLIPNTYHIWEVYKDKMNFCSSSPFKQINNNDFKRRCVLAEWNVNSTTVKIYLHGDSMYNYTTVSITNDDYKHVINEDEIKFAKEKELQKKATEQKIRVDAF